MLPEHNLTNLAKLIFNVKNYSCKDEANTKSNIITPILQALNWNVNSQFEVEREYLIEGIGRVDYALKVIDEVRVLIEAKSMRDDLDKYDNQIRKYAIADIHLFILSNGIRWQFYTWLKRGVGIYNFYTLNLNVEEPHFIANELYNILSKQSIISKISDNYIKNIIVKDPLKYSSYNAIDEVLHNILDEPSSLLCNLIVVEVNKAFNINVEQDDVKKILNDYNKLFKINRDEIKIFIKKNLDVLHLSSKTEHAIKTDKLRDAILKVRAKTKSDIIPIRDIIPWVHRQMTPKEREDSLNALCSVGFCELIGRKVRVLDENIGK